MLVTADPKGATEAFDFVLEKQSEVDLPFSQLATRLSTHLLVGQADLEESFELVKNEARGIDPASFELGDEEVVINGTSVEVYS